MMLVMTRALLRARVQLVVASAGRDPCLQAADRRRQSVISDLLKTDYRRQRQLVEATIVSESLKINDSSSADCKGTAMEPAKSQSEQEEASSSS
ncbi:hypothetical protein Tco_0679813 [Tanacetum coccineum]|uniref:Uncharacterized protein n=1 Tax=Tanacetum coccineum TaxID=301880 RepID=A0ABQ4XJ48_9ASTR